MEEEVAKILITLAVAMISTAIVGRAGAMMNSTRESEGALRELIRHMTGLLEPPNNQDFK